MKKLFSALLLAISLNSYGQQYQLTVGDGDGSGAYAAGDTAFVLANPTPAGFVFDYWQTTAALRDTFAVPTRLAMPAQPVTLSPVYRAAPAWTPVFEVRPNGSNLYYHFPAPAARLKGIISFHHGATGNASGWVSKLENRTFLNYAVAHGYAVFATESVDRLTNPAAGKQWSNGSTVATNPDVQNIQAILASFQARGFTTASTRVFGVGFSQGSGFTSIVSALLNFRANSLGATPGLTAAINVTSSPTYWMASRNDTLEDRQRLQKCLSNYQLLQSRGIPVRLKIHEPFPVTPNRFRRIAGVDSATSADIFNRLRTGGFLDARNFLNFNPRAASPWRAAMPAAYAPFLDDVDDQLYICFTEHKFHSDQEYDVIRFFDRFAAPVVTAATPAASVAPALRAYPNPTLGWVTLANDQREPQAVEVLNALGQRLFELPLEAGATRRYDLSDLLPGTYFLRSATGTTRLVRQ
ncbi:T9SS type A sorting domain-containing protein [Hymenobacter sp.]|uniref:T9SS type A sorting domain-containing protein n=1 Tax=Hymenobacter sp. TaxID=1898978 RepID=UPI00286C024E|nr:T9SS type A sorting domain-containing protein [Hymenobacter sp.]